MSRTPIPTWCFSVVVVRKGDRFLLVHERKHGQLWYLPAGRVEPGESFQVAAVRETQEEAGIAIRLRGVLRMEHTPDPQGARLRVIFFGEPVDDSPLKSVADEESLGAAWVSLAEIDRYELRGPDVREYFEYVARGGSITPMSVLTLERASLF